VGTLDPVAVATKMRALPVNDFMSKDVHIRPDGRVMRDMYVVSVKSPAESKKPWDYFSLIAEIPPDQAFRPISEGGCALVAG
jgi:branched-chain amino acid transport system substrate-binding protein